MIGQVSSDELLKVLRRRIRPLEVDYMPLERGWGRCLAEDLALGSGVTQPIFAEVEGFGVRFEDVMSANPQNPVNLKLVHYHPNNLEFVLGRNKAIKVTPGMPLPAACDTVIPASRAVQLDEKTLQVRFDVKRRGQGTRVGSSNGKAGQLIAKGTRLTPARCLYLAELGIAEVPVHRPPTIGVLTLGEEWVPIRTRRLKGEQRRNLIPHYIHQLGEELRSPTLELEPTSLEGEELAEELKGVVEQVDLLVMVGNSPRGLEALRRAGRVSVAGTGVEHAEEFALGSVGEVPVVVLPTDPARATLAGAVFLRAVIMLRNGQRLLDWPGIVLSDLPHPAGEGGKEALVPALVEGGGALSLIYPLPERSFWAQDHRVEGVVLFRKQGSPLYIEL